MTNPIVTPSTLPGIGGGTILSPGTSSQSSTTSTTSPGKTGSGGWESYITGGWAIVVGFGIGILLGATQFAPLVAGVIGVGLIYQLVNVVQGKAP